LATLENNRSQDSETFFGREDHFHGFTS